MNTNPPYAMGGIVDSAPAASLKLGEAFLPHPSDVALTQFGQRLMEGGRAEMLVTQMLENSLAELENLRRHLQVTNRQNIADVRDAASPQALALLLGNDLPIGYRLLVRTINEMRSGLAQRRVVLQH